MKFYHFTSKHHVDGCKTTGIIMGMLPLSIEPPKLKNGYQWLTTNPDFDQSWDRAKNLPYDRTEYRLTIEIPDKHKTKILKFTTDIKKILPKFIYGAMSGYGEPGNWYVFHGLIPSKWIKKVERKPADAPK